MAWLGLDAGGSATRWALVDRTGACLARGAGPPISGHLFDEAAVSRARDAAGAIAAALPGRPAGILAGITGLGAGTPAADVARDIFAAAFAVPPAEVAIRDDLWIAYHAVFRPGEGHVVYAGTGSIGMHIAADGSIVRVGGRGPLIDDAGSAFAFGRGALAHIWQCRDDDPAFRSPLSDAVDGVIGSADWDAHRAYVYGGGRNAVAQLAPAIAAADDPWVRRAMRHAGGALARLAEALVRRAGDRTVAVLGQVPDLHPEYMAAFRHAGRTLTYVRRRPDAALAAAHLAAGADAVQATDLPSPEEETS